MLTWQPLTRSFAGCAEPRSPVVHGRQWPALVPGQDGHGAGGRDWPPTIAASQQLPSGCRWLLTWHRLGSPRIAATTVRSSGRSGGMPTHWRWLGTAMARLDPSKWRAAATRTSCEITGSRAGSGSDPACGTATHRPAATKGLGTSSGEERGELQKMHAQIKEGAAETARAISEMVVLRQTSLDHETRLGETARSLATVVAAATEAEPEKVSWQQQLQQLVDAQRDLGLSMRSFELRCERCEGGLAAVATLNRDVEDLRTRIVSTVRNMHAACRSGCRLYRFQMHGANSVAYVNVRCSDAEH